MMQDFTEAEKMGYGGGSTKPLVMSSLPIAEIIGADQPWSLYDVLNKLIEASDILLHKKNYDGHGWEEIYHAAKRARYIAGLFEGNAT